MKKTKRIASFLVVAMLASLLSVFPVMTASAGSAIQISNEEPAILANVGTAVTLSNYSVQLDNGTVLSPSDITWYDGENKITSYTPSESGVKQLTAKKTSDSSVSKTIYVVSKLSTETEYVLFSTDFSNVEDINGWNKTSSASGVYTVSNGKLTMNGDASNPRIYLPEWLSDFANYRIDTVATQANPTDSSRWFAMIYRAQNAATTGTPYYDMCVRNNMAAAATENRGGVECVSLTNGWTYYDTTSYKGSVDSSKNYNFAILVKDDTVQYQINDDIVIHVDNLPMIANTKKGGIGLQANSSKFIVDSIKVSIQQTTPEKPEAPAPKLINVRHPETNTLNHIANIGLVQSLEELNSYNSSSNAPSTLIFYANGANLTTKSGTTLCTIDDLMKKAGSLTYIPAFYVKDKSTVDTIVKAIQAASLEDVLFISNDATIVKYAREQYTIARGAVDFTDIDELLSSEKLLEIRGTVNEAKSLIAILPEKLAIKDYVTKLQSNAITVWVMDENLDGNAEAAKLITSGATGIITNDFAAIEKALTTLFVPNTMTKTSIIVGHRGNPTQAPENSISGYLKAIENGADVVETDIKFSKDNEIVVMHDPSITRTTSYTGNLNVNQMTLEEIKEYNLWGEGNKFKDDYPNEKVPTLEEMLKAIKPTEGKIFIEIKTGDVNIVQPMVDLVKKYDMESRVSVICFDAAQLLKTQQLFPSMSTGYLLYPPAKSSSIEEALNALYERLNNIQPINSTMNPNAGNINEYYANAAGDRGITLWPWTYNASWSALFEDHFRLGIDALTTNDAQYSKDMVKNISTNKNAIFLKNEGSKDNFIVKSETYGGTSLTDITDDDKAFIKVLEGEDLITVENGKVTAKAESGTASFMVGYTTTTKAGATYVLYSQPITVKLGTEGGLKLNEDSKYETNKYLDGVTDKTTLKDFLSNFKNSENIIVLDKDGKKVTSESAFIGTNYKVQYIYENNVIQEITVVVLGDVSCNGKIDSKDYLFVKRAFLGTIDLTETQLKAACLSRKPAPVAKDYLKIKRHFLGTYNLYE